ncbi:MAG: exopolysaccharide biosynthesis polyprenyl glycosylphosphotransferase [Agathobacter sp.]|nr:exopolysaccharide biosynthesis polyprenyl glycosylphosphotransferase [Agathobacter sp.]
MIAIKKSFANFMIYALKMLMYASLLLSFVFVFGRDSFALLQPSRTMGITWLTYIVVLLLMVAIYGKYDIGRRKNKPIIYSLGLAVVLTDIITYLELMIMNTITPDLLAFRLTNIGELLGILGLHTLIVIGFVAFGNWMYFKLIPPEKCCIITNKDAKLEQITRSIKKYQKQYEVKRIVDYRRTDLEEIISQMDTVFLYDVPVSERTDIVHYCYEHLINIYINPEITDIVENLAEYYLLDDVSMLNFNVEGLTLEQRFFKRTFDIILSALAIIISSPIWIIAAIAIKLGDGGPVFFKQNRATRDGKVFQVYKFRTMKQNVENRSATADDDRITKAGHILRKTRMDELPQFLNIFLGDMSFVGPRPEMLENVYSYTEELPEFQYRLRVKAGLTGYAQIAGKYNTTPKDKLIMDMMYIERYSFWNDIKLCFQTLIVLLKSDSTEGFQTRNDVFQVEETPESKKIK